MIIFPAMDIYDDKVVRLYKGDFNKLTIYNNSVIEQVEFFYKNNIKWLHIVDLVASKTGELTTINLLKWIKTNTDIKIQFGGGIRNIKIIEELICLGIDKLILGTVSLDYEFLSKINEKFGSERFVIAADNKDDEILVKGWTGNASTNIYTHIKRCNDIGFNTFLVTDINKDGTLESPNFTSYENLQKRFPDINIIVSGGISCINDIIKIRKKKYYGVIVGKAFYNKNISIEEIQNNAY